MAPIDPSYVDPKWSRMLTVEGDLFVPRDEARQKCADAATDIKRLREALKGAVNNDHGWRRRALDVLGVQWNEDPRDG